VVRYGSSHSAGAYSRCEGDAPALADTFKLDRDPSALVSVQSRLQCHRLSHASRPRCYVHFTTPVQHPSQPSRPLHTPRPLAHLHIHLTPPPLPFRALALVLSLDIPSPPPSERRTSPSCSDSNSTFTIATPALTGTLNSDGTSFGPAIRPKTDQLCR
jgi:hypothetical protein